MSVADGSPGTESSRLWRYGVAVLSVVVAAAVRLALDPFVGTEHVLFAFHPRRRSGVPNWRDRSGPACLALSVLTAWYFFIEPRFSFAITNESNVGSLAVLAAAGAGVSLLIGQSPPASNRGRKAKGDRSFLRRTILFVSALLVLTVFTRFLYDDFASERDRQQWMTHSYQVISATRALLSNLQDAETGQRGYLLTGDESYREPFDSALREQQSIRQTLRQLAAGDPAQQATLDNLTAWWRRSFWNSRRPWRCDGRE